MGASAGDTLEKSWLHVSSSMNCGKMKALEQLLQAWHSAGDNKVGLASLPPPSVACWHVGLSKSRTR